MIPKLIDLFVPGFIAICIYTNLHNKKYEFHTVCLWSIFISYFVSNLYNVLYDFFGLNILLGKDLKSILCILICAIMPFIVTYMIRTNIFQTFLLKSNYQTIHSDIFDDVIDYDQVTVMSLYLKNSNYYYIGHFSLLGYRDGHSYITLIKYSLIDKETHNEFHHQEEDSTVMVCLEDVERIEINYSEDSKVWKNLKAGNNR